MNLKLLSLLLLLQIVTISLGSNEIQFATFETNSSKLLVAGGISDPSIDDIRGSEIIDLSDPNQKCDLMEDIQLSFGVGGLVMHNNIKYSKPIFCGGISNDDDYLKLDQDCYVVRESDSKYHSTMSQGRSFASSVVLSHGELWITGGIGLDSSNATQILKTTEKIYVNQDFSYLGPELEQPLAGHCMLLLDEVDDVLIVGGKTSDYITTGNAYYRNYKNPEVTSVGSLNFSRMDHSCGLTYKKDGTKVVVVAGGSQMTGPNTFKTLDSVEILQWINEELQEWKQGPLLPIPLRSASMVTASNNNLILIGGYRQDNGWNDDLFELNIETMEWHKMEQSLQAGRAGHISFFIPDDWTSCSTLTTTTSTTPITASSILNLSNIWVEILLTLFVLFVTFI